MTMLTTFRMDPSRPLKREALRASLEPGGSLVGRQGSEQRSLTDVGGTR